MAMIVGLTGGIGSGKSTVLKYFQQLDVPTESADQISRTLVEPGQQALKLITKKFGKAILKKDGTLNRKLLGEKIFRKEADRLWLESIMHPLIEDAIKRWAHQLKADYGIVEIPLLVESGFREAVDKILVIDCTENFQIKRVWHRDNMPPKQVAAILESQATRQERLAIATETIPNEGSLNDLYVHTLAMHEHYTRLIEQTKAPKKKVIQLTPPPESHSG